MSIGSFIGETEQLRGLASKWMSAQNGSDFGFDMNIEDGLKELDTWRQAGICEVLVDVEGDEIKGGICLYEEQHELGRGKIAIIKYWYVEHGSGLSLFAAARKWAREKGCTHMAAYASNIAGDMHDKMCKLYRALGMKLFETMFIEEIKNEHENTEVPTATLA